MLLVFAMQLVFPQSTQHHSQMGDVFVSVFGSNKDIIYKYHHKLVQIGSENSIHMIHEDRRGIGQAKRHHSEFIVTKSGPECDFENIFKYEPKLMLS